MDPPLIENIEIPVDRQTLFQHNPDLRGHRLPQNPEGMPCKDNYFPAGPEFPVTGT